MSPLRHIPYGNIEETEPFPKEPSSFKSRVYILTGCTATGKSSLAVAWALRHSAQIISCDSLLFYRGMDIGTAKPTGKERERVPHHLIDLREPNQPVDVSAYEKLAEEAVREIRSAGFVPLVVGGSGFYLKVFFQSATDGIPVDAALRQSLEQQWQEEGLEPLVCKLESLNPDGLGTLDRKNPRRVIRALERSLTSGLTLRELASRRAQFRNQLMDLPKETVVLDGPDQWLRERIATRSAGMVQSGLIPEVERLLGLGLEQNPSAGVAIGYRETIQLLRERRSEEWLVETICRNTWQLVRKQRTWFRHQLPHARWLSAPDTTPESLSHHWEAEDPGSGNHRNSGTT